MDLVWMLEKHQQSFLIPHVIYKESTLHLFLILRLMASLSFRGVQLHIWASSWSVLFLGIYKLPIRSCVSMPPCIALKSTNIIFLCKYQLDLCFLLSIRSLSIAVHYLRILRKSTTCVSTEHSTPASNTFFK